MELQAQTSSYRSSLDLLSMASPSVKSNTASTLATPIASETLASEALAFEPLASELGEIRMTPLAQSFQSLFSVLDQVSSSMSAISPDSALIPNTSASESTASFSHSVLSYSQLFNPELLSPGFDTTHSHSPLTRLEASAEGLNLSDRAAVQSFDSPQDFVQQPQVQLPQLSTIAHFVTQQLELMNQRRGAGSEFSLKSSSLLSSKGVDHSGADWQASTPSFVGHTPNRYTSSELALSFNHQLASSMFNATPASLKLGATSTTPLLMGQPIVEAVNATSDSSYVRASAPMVETTKELSLESQRQIHQVLRDKIQLQFDTLNQAARIRFDPPELGKVEMYIRVDGDKVNIQMSASSALTREAILATSERLRHELISQNSELSEVNISLDQPSHHQPESKQQNQPFEQERLSSSDAHTQDQPEYVLEYQAYIARV
ncbi:flagellar hook-length control protein FliK [Vibrio sp. 1CM8B]|uniref:flagellar hook-length control protein FliK n=1 Tax=Vibrio sp. 1CM8B TaxID=2929167 RepID=UPI0020BD8D1F|nr:flagellar hook-length control protein FliK [Vibrio sp. 1CM8B]MCK8084315.1 flagellar hook-length control protein FliK [Vibrio sp. 1CM8B]